MAKNPNILVIGLGNQLHGDEGVGIHVAERMNQIELPEGVEVMDGGTIGHDMIFYLEGRSKLICVDAVKMGQTPGTIYRFEPRELAVMPTEFFSLYELKMANALADAELQGRRPEAVLIGVEPGTCQPGLELSAEVEARVPEVIGKVLEEIQTRTP
jgi:hydrogenase maturation protease